MDKDKEQKNVQESLEEEDLSKVSGGLLASVSRGGSTIDPKKIKIVDEG